MELNITFGWHLDGPSYPEESAIGRLVVGPIGMLSQLCLRLGLTSLFPPQSVRIAEFMSRLRELDDGKQFYSQSFKTDSWGTAKSLLFLRDDLVASGLNFENVDSLQAAPERIATLARVNAGAKNLSCLTDSINKIADRLELVERVHIDRIILVDEETLLPPVWQRLFATLRSKHVVVESWNLAHPEVASENGERGLSARVARWQRAGTTDGSLIILESDDEVQAADCITSLLATTMVSPHEESTVFIRGSSTSFLDQLLAKRNLPSLAGADKSPLRGYMQLLPMAFELSWKPFDPLKMIEFLTIPKGPIRPSTARRFINALRDQPGIGSGAWLKAWSELREVLLKRLKERSSENANLEQLLLERELALKEWLEPQMFDTQEGMPSQVVVALCDRVRKHAHLRANTLSDSYSNEQMQVFIKTAVAAETLAATVVASNAEKLSRSQLLRMMESSIGDGYSPDSPQASPWTPVDHPGQIIAPADSVIWWGFVDYEKHGVSNPWNTAEIEFLNSVLVFLDNPQTAVVREARSWSRPLLAGAKRLLLVKPRTVAGRTVAAHPFYHEISSAIEAMPHDVRATIVKQAHEIYAQPSTELAGLHIVSAKQEPLVLPGQRPTWSITPRSMKSRVESATSLERLLACPMSWLFKYKANLKYGSLLSVSSGEQLSGVVAHAVLAAIFSIDDWQNHSDVEQRAERLFDEFCPKIAAPLLLPGNSLERQRLKKAICEAAVSLSALIKDAGFSKVILEEKKDATIDDVALTGRPDIYLVHPDNRDFVIDLKWSRRAPHRRRELSEGRAIQLALYATLLKRETGNPTNAGYYMIAQRQLFATSRQPFPDHTYVEGPSLDQTFSNLLKNCKQHMTHLEAGTVYATGITVLPPLDDVIDESGVDIVIDDDPEQPASKIPDITLALEPPCRICDFGRLCGKKEFDA